MIHNHVTELRELLLKFAPNIWPLLKDSPTDYDLSEKIKIVGDFPQLQLLQQLRDYTAETPLRAILSLLDSGSVTHRTFQAGAYKSDNVIIVSMTLTTSDPELREELGGNLTEFMGKNMALFKGTKSPWRADNFVSSGVVTTQADLYARAYRLWVREIS